MRSKIYLKDKKIGCIRDAAKERGGKEAYRNVWDLSFFEKEGAQIVDLSIENMSKELFGQRLSEVDILFVGGGDTVYLLELLEKRDLKKMICTFVKDGIPYLGTSAGSMVTSEVVHYKKGDSWVRGLGLININILPHWNQPRHKKYWFEQMEEVYDFPYPTLLLNDVDAVVVDEFGWRVERSGVHTLEEVFEKADAENRKNG